MKPLRPDEFPPPPATSGISRRKLLFGGAGLVGLAGTATGAYAAAIEPYELVVTQYRPKLPRWPAGLRLTISVIADLHAGGPNVGRAHIRHIVDVTNALQSDLVVLLGDYFATHRFITERVPHDVWAGELGRLRAPLGVYAVLGNHDWWHDITGSRNALIQAGIPVLENDVRRLSLGSGGFWLAGLGDQLAYRIGYRHFRGVDDLPGTLSRITSEEPVLLLAHEPDIFTQVPDRVALTLAGHTHGGQVRVPLIWPAFVPSQYGARFAYGHIVEGGRHLIVSGGIGTSKAPIRFGVPPEILKITLG